MSVSTMASLSFFQKPGVKKPRIREFKEEQQSRVEPDRIILEFLASRLLGFSEIARPLGRHRS
jgi:hypothetical protein